jgi:hypothetical protein
MSRRLYQLSLWVIISLAVAAPAPVLAHIWQSAGSISVLVHVDPADAPKSGEPSVVHVEFTDKQDLFTVQRCDCHIRISRDGQTLKDSPLPATVGQMRSNYNYIFPAPGIYLYNGQGTAGAGRDV